MAKNSTVRERILEVASRLFYYQGYNQTGINQIISDAEIAIGSLYKHFPSKTDLLKAYLQKEHEQWLKGFRECTVGESDPNQKLLRLLDYKIRLQENAECAGCHFIKITNEVGKQEKEVLKLVMDYKEEQQAMIGDLVCQLRVSKEWDKDLLTNTIFLLMEGGTTTATIYNNTNALKKAKAFVVALMV